MTLVRWTPLRDATNWHPVTDLTTEIFNMQREVDRLFDRFRGGSVDESNSNVWMPAVDIIERENDFYIKAELPGVQKADVKITVQENVLTIRGEKKQEMEKKGDNLHRVERAYGTFQRSFTLPSSVRNDKIEASYDSGVLTISLPKIEESKPKEIEVRVK